METRISNVDMDNGHAAWTDSQRYYHTPFKINAEYKHIRFHIWSRGRTTDRYWRTHITRGRHDRETQSYAMIGTRRWQDAMTGRHYRSP
jgi:hypothetical protein